MRCEVVAVGTELLLGQIVDTNSAWIGEQLALSGIEHLRQTKVGDNRRRIVEVLRDALGRADAVIVCGGLGPTQDDITRDAIRSEEHTSELQSLMRISYAVFCLKKKKKRQNKNTAIKHKHTTNK